MLHYTIIPWDFHLRSHDGEKPRPKAQAGVVAMGPDLVAVDTTCARIMGLRPERIAYLAEASRFLGNLEEAAIPQRAEPLEAFQDDFAVLEAFAHLKSGGARKPPHDQAASRAIH